MGTKLRDVFNLQTSAAPLFYQSVEEIKGDCRNPFSQHMLVAWEKLGLSGIYCVSGRPTVYFKEYLGESPAIAALQQNLWNQGIAPLLVLLGETSVWVVSGMLKPTKAAEQDRLVVNHVNLAADALYLKSFINRVESGAIFFEDGEKFNRKQTVDRYLVANLQELARQVYAEVFSLNAQIQRDAVHRFLCRIIFICYLEDRDLLGPGYYSSLGLGCRRISELFSADPESVATLLMSLFAQLRTDFNGSLFEDEYELLPILLCHPVVPLFQRFFKGEDLSSSQMSLFFWPYQFEMIPTETISTIYESFLSEEQSQNQSGAYYTPYFFAEMVWDFALDEKPLDLASNILDPACGSGIFLVIAFNRMAQLDRVQHPGAGLHERADRLLSLLKNNIYGVDVNPTACKITCFSLYLALLSQFQADEVRQLRSAGFKLPYIPIANSDFFAEEVHSRLKFDRIIGNPPWVSRKELSVAATAWMAQKGAELDIPASQQDAVFAPQQQLAHLFMWKVLDHLQPQGAACLILDSGVFLNQTSGFQKHWLARANLGKVLQVCDWRHLLFENAKAPACVVCFDCHFSQKPHIPYISPQVNRRDPRSGVVHIDARDIKSLRRQQLQAMADQGQANLYWKKRMRGTSRDQEVLDFLLGLPKLANLISSGRWQVGQGIIRGKNPAAQKDPVWWSGDRLFLDANKPFKYLLAPDLLEPVGSRFGTHVERARSSQRHDFDHCMFIFNQGFSKFAFCDQPVLFQDSLQYVAGPEQDAKYLFWAMVVFGSKLARYYHFHLASNLGVERKKVHLNEAMNTPFFLPENSERCAEQAAIIDRAYALLPQIRSELNPIFSGRKIQTERSFAALEKEVYAYFDLQPRHIALIEDVSNIYYPSATPPHLLKDIPSLRAPKSDERRVYVETFCDSFAEMVRGGHYRFSGECILAPKQNLALVKIHRGPQNLPYRELVDESDLITAFVRLQEHSNKRQTHLLYGKSAYYFDDQTLTMLLPLELARWTRTAAMNDSDAAVRDILLGGDTHESA